jgi:glycosyltransferase involved in cell wall biosynthesis
MNKRPTRLIIQIPCFNEEEALPETMSALPKTIEGADIVEILVVNDGSTDRTVEVARSLGAHYILDIPTNRGLAHTFSAGLMEAARLGADYLVNLDADNQYCADDIGKLLKPLAAGEADMVIGERPIADMEHFSSVKQKLQQIGSWVVQQLGGHGIKDAPSGFRALNRNAMIRMHIFNSYTYTLESLIAARELDLRVVGVPIRVNPGKQRPSRLVRSTFNYVKRSSAIILRTFLIYNPYKLLLWLSALFVLPAAVLVARFFFHYFAGEGSGYIQSLIIAGMLLTLGLMTFMVAVVCDIMMVNRRLTQKLLEEFRRSSLAAGDGARVSLVSSGDSGA